MKINLCEFSKVRRIVEELDKVYFDDVVDPSWYDHYVDKAKVAVIEDRAYMLYVNVTPILFTAICSGTMTGDYCFSPNHFDVSSNYMYLAAIVGNRNDVTELFKYYRDHHSNNPTVMFVNKDEDLYKELNRVDVGSDKYIAAYF